MQQPNFSSLSLTVNICSAYNALCEERSLASIMLLNVHLTATCDLVECNAQLFDGVKELFSRMGDNYVGELAIPIVKRLHIDLPNHLNLNVHIGNMRIRDEKVRY